MCLLLCCCCFSLMGLFKAMLMMGLVIQCVGVGTVALRAIVIMVLEAQVATDDGD